MNPTHEVELFGSYGARHAASGTTIDQSNRKSPKDPLGPLCRTLLATGVAQADDRIHVVRGVMPVFKRDRKVGTWAGEDWVDTQTSGPHRRKWVPFTSGEGLNRGSEE